MDLVNSCGHVTCGNVSKWFYVVKEGLPKDTKNLISEHKTNVIRPTQT